MIHVDGISFLNKRHM